MASWTDRPQSFNPYVAQLPVEAMVNVGMQKQHQYDEGIQKIQSSIDNIAGMDLARDVDKNYLQTKLNSLTTNLRTVAAGDFSNAQLTNSVVGMTNSLVKDKNIENALYSTKVVRKGQAENEAARKAGKSSPENDLWWNDQVNEYLNDTDLKTTFNGRYIEYTDIDKKLNELGDKLKEIDATIDEPFIIDKATGKPKLDEQGNPTVNTALIRTRTKGISAERLINTFMDNLNEKDKQQLMITSNYHYKGATVGTFRNDVEETYQERKKMLGDRVSEMSVKLATDDSLTAAEKAALEAEITSASEKYSKGMEEDKEKEFAQLGKITTPEELKAYKYQLYTQKHLTAKASNMANMSVSQTIETNPYFQAEMQIKKLQFDVDQSNRRHAEWAAGMAWDKEKFGRQEARADRKEAKEDAKYAPYVVTKTGINPDGKGPTLSDVYSDIDTYKANIKQLNSEYGRALFPKSLDIQKDLNGLISKWNTNPGSITDPNQRKYIQRYAEESRQLNHSALLAKEVEQSTSVYDARIDQQLKGANGVLYKGGKKELYSAKELLNFQSDTERFMYTTTTNSAATSTIGGYGSSPIKVQKLDGKALMNRYRGTKMELLARAYVKKYSNETMDANEMAVINKTKELTKVYSPLIYQAKQAKIKKQNEILKNRVGEFTNIQGTLNPENKQDMARIKEVVASELVSYSELGGANSQKIKDFDPTVIGEMLGKTGTGYTFTKSHDGSALLSITNGGDVQKMKLSAESFRSAFPQYAQISPVNEVKRLIQQTTNKTTNILGGKNPVGAYYTGYDLPQLRNTSYASRVKVDVEGALDGSPNQYVVRVYYYDNNAGWISDIVNQEGFVSEEGLQATLNGIGTGIIDELRKLNNKK